MRVLYIGDFESDSGPGVANRMLLRGLSDIKGTYNTKKMGQIDRIRELLYWSKKVDAFCFTSYSKLCIIGIIIAKIRRLKTCYVMHGSVELELKLNSYSGIFKISDKLNIVVERLILRSIDQIVCVSKKFSTYIKAEYKWTNNKVDFIFNAMDLRELYDYVPSRVNNEEEYTIVSVGGGKKLKNNLSICRAIELITTDYDMKIKYIVIGSGGADKDEIMSYGFVEYHDFLPREELLGIMYKANIYIQNSNFETFGLAVVEALIMKCKLLMSSEIGAIDVIKGLTDKNIINDTNDYTEISKKIYRLLNDKNQNIDLNYELIEPTNVARKLNSIINDI